MRKEKARALAICSLIDRAVEKGLDTKEGKEYMKVAKEWMQDKKGK